MGRAFRLADDRRERRLAVVVAEDVVALVLEVDVALALGSGLSQCVDHLFTDALG